MAVRQTPKSEARAGLFLSLLGRLGVPQSDSTRIMDLGCGAGELVAALRRRGFDAYGCDFTFKDGQHTETLGARNIIRLIGTEPYALPFPDDYFDAVISDQVFEHVADLDETNAELRRVLKPQAYGVHIFPSKFTLIEPHVGVPLATIFQSKSWLRFWHAVGVGRRAGVETDLTIAEQNANYLKSYTHYRTRRAFDAQTRKYFAELTQLEHLFLEYRLRSSPRLLAIGRFRLFVWLYRTFRDRIISVRKSGLDSRV